MSKRLAEIPRPVLLIAGVSLLLALILLLDAIPFLRGGFGWQWPYKPASLARGLPLIVLTVIYIAGAWWLLGRTGRALPALLWAFLGAAVIPLAVIALRGDPFFELFARTISAITTGTHRAAADIDWSGTAWHDWTAIMRGFNQQVAHVSINPPGLPMWYGALNGLLDGLPGLADPLQRVLLPYQCSSYTFLDYTPGERASAWFGILMPLWAALTVFPMYGIARRFRPERARLAVTWWPLVPVLVMFAPSWNTVYPLVGAAAFWMLLVGLERGARWFIGAGMLAGLLTFASFSNVPLVLLCGVYVLLVYGFSERQTRPWTRPVIVGLWFGIGLALPWALFYLVGGQTPFDILAASFSQHLELDRPYVPWIWLHFWDWAIFTGIPLVLLWLYLSWKRLRGDRQESLLGPALLLTFIILLLSNTARGETGRVWLVFAPFALIVAAGLPAFDRKARVSWLVITIGQAILMLVMAFTWFVISADDIHPRPDSPGGLATTHAVEAAFGDDFRLVGWDAAQADGEIVLTLDWQGQRQMTTPYWFAALLVNPEGAPVGEPVVWQPLDTRYPTTCWRSGEVIGDSIHLPLPENAESGGWWVSLTAFADVQNPADVLPVIIPGAEPDVQVGLGPVAVVGLAQ